MSLLWYQELLSDGIWLVSYVDYVTLRGQCRGERQPFCGWGSSGVLASLVSLGWCYGVIGDLW